MKRLIYQVNVAQEDNQVTYATNKPFRYVTELYKLSNNQAEKYANEVGADYKLITDCSFLPDKHPTFQKFKVFDWANEYEQILYLDSDAVVLNNIPNIFDLYGNYDFSATTEANWDSTSVYYKKFRLRYNKILGGNEEYRPFNAGVMLMNSRWLQKNKDNWQQYLYTFDKHGAHDQGMFNRLIIDEGGNYNFLPFDWGSWVRKANYIVHLGGYLKKNFDPVKFCKKYNLSV